jgi:ABC-2 type transport system permease protein
MRLRTTVAILRKDLALGPRSPLVAWALIMPVVMTLLVHGVFGSLFDSRPRVGVVDPGGSELAAALLVLPELDARLVADETTLERLVRAHDLDAGLVLAPGFDAALRGGDRPALPLFVSGESLASDRVIVSVTTLDLVRAVEGRTAPVTVEVITTGDAPDTTLTERMVPLLVLLAMLVSGVFVTSFSLVEERERRTLDALLVTPASLGDVLVAKGTLGLVLAVTMGAVTLALNGALRGSPPGLLLALLVGALMSVTIGLLYGVVSSDARSLYTLFKSLNIVLIGPVVFYLFPDWPQWIARLFPTYWFLDPIVAVSTRGADLPAVLPDLLVALAICAVLAAIVALAARRLQGPPAIAA